MTANWFDVDKDGLAKLIEKRGKAFVIHELLQNAWDTKATKVTVTVKPIPNRSYAEIVVIDDDEEGFQNLKHAFTLFAESNKKSDPTKRGRFNLGEKLVLALCESAEIRTTTGAVGFDHEGRWTSNSVASRLDRGTVFKGVIRMTRAEMDEVIVEVTKLIPPPTIVTEFNGTVLKSREPLKTLRLTLPTEISDEEGIMRKTARQTTVRIYSPLDGEEAAIYEMGIPIVETGDKWHVDVDQKVPLNVDRDNVTPAYLRTLRVEVLNAMHAHLDKEDMTDRWVREGSEDERCVPEATETVMTGRFGEKRVAFDPTDPQANALAQSRGYTVIPGGSMSAGEWFNAKSSGAVLPAGKVTPSPKPYGEDGEMLKLINESDWTPGMKSTVKFAKALGRQLLGTVISVRLANEFTWPFSATFGKNGTLVLNVGRLGKAWFDRDHSDVEVVSLLIHEFGHYFESNHLCEDYYDALTDLGAKAVRLALTMPELFQKET